MWRRKWSCPFVYLLPLPFSLFVFSLWQRVSGSPLVGVGRHTVNDQTWLLSFDPFFWTHQEPCQKCCWWYGGDCPFSFFLFPPVLVFFLSERLHLLNLFCGSHDWSVGGRDAEWHLTLFRNLLFLTAIALQRLQQNKTKKYLKSHNWLSFLARSKILKMRNSQEFPGINFPRALWSLGGSLFFHCS